MNNLRSKIVTIVISVVGVLFYVSTAYAQLSLPTSSGSSTEVSSPSPNDLRELSRLLSDPKIQQWLKNAGAQKQLDGDTSDTGSASFRNQLDLSLTAVRDRLSEIETASQMLPTAPATITKIWQNNIDGSETLRTITSIIIFLFIGAGMEWLFWQYFTSTLKRVEFTTHETLRQRINSALSRIMINGGALLTFAAGSIGAFLSFTWLPEVQYIVLSLLISIISVRIILAIAKFLLAPNVPGLRFVPLSSGPAKRLYFWTALSAIISFTVILISDNFSYLAALPDSPQSAASAALSISMLASLIITGVLLVSVWKMGKSAAKVRPEAANTSGKIGNAMPIFLMVLIVICVVLWLLGAREMMWTLVIIALIIPTIALVSRLIEHLFDQAEGEAQPSDNNLDAEFEGEAGGETAEEISADEWGRYDLYRPISIRLSRFVLVIGAMVALAAVWGVSLLSLSSDNLSGRIFSIAVDVTVAVLIADLIWVWAKTAIDRKMASFGELFSAGGEGGGAAGPEARMATLLPILRKILMITIFLMVSLSILSSMGINIAPILAGAGVAGIAIGFGAQALVKDIVSGIFFLLDDAFRVGEYIEMGDLRGTVESMSLRSLRVRHHLGAIHTIPFGELSSLTNYSRDWVIMKLEFRVPFDTDIQLVKRLVKKVNLELKAHEGYGHHLLGPLKSQGVRRMEEFNMVIGVKFMASPGEQWLIRRDAYQKIRDIFEENGISFAQRSVEVKVVSDQPITPEMEEAAASAAQEATENQMPPAPPKDEP